jgi:RES domain-containing protein
MSRRPPSRSRSISRSSLKARQRLPQIKKAKDPTARLNSVLVDLSRKTEKELEYWRVFQQYLADQRDIRRDRILATLRQASVSGYENNQLVRIVDARYQTRPLSSYGSVVVPPGGRFNFGDISDYYQRFQALYLASDFRTAASERFLRSQTSDSVVDQESLDLRLDPQASFSSYRVSVANLRVIDLRNDSSLEEFTEIISEIDPPLWMHYLAKRMKQPVPETIKTAARLRATLLDPNFTQSGSLIDQPSASQWFGFYVRAAGLHGVIYPSVRALAGYNLALFPDNFRDSLAKVELVDEAAGVKSEDRVLDGATAQFQMLSSTSDIPSGECH